MFGGDRQVRRRHTYELTDDDASEPLLREVDNSSSAAPASSERQLSTSHGTIEAFLQSVAARFISCTAQVYRYIAWLLGSLHQRLTPEQIESLARLRDKLDVKFEHSNPDHEKALKELWQVCFPEEDYPAGSKSERWKDAGFQGTDPASDFRGGGLFSLQNMLCFSRRHPHAFRRLLLKTNGLRQDLEYPFCAAGINITFKLEELLELRVRGHCSEAPPSQAAGHAFAALLVSDGDAFEELYAAAFEVLDREWLQRRATYMEFPVVLDAAMAVVRDALQGRPRSVGELRRALGLEA